MQRNRPFRRKNGNLEFRDPMVHTCFKLVQVCTTGALNSRWPITMTIITFLILHFTKISEKILNCARYLLIYCISDDRFHMMTKTIGRYPIFRMIKSIGQLSYIIVIIKIIVNSVNTPRESAL